MSRIIYTAAMLLAVSFGAKAQTFAESVQPLSKKATKGFVYDISKDESGVSHVTYKIQGDKKSDNVSFEEYNFDKDLKFVDTKDVQEKKEQKDDRTVTTFFPFVGGTTSFDVLSMKLKINKVVKEQTWSHEKQAYVTKKVDSRETVKAKNDAGKVYIGYASFTHQNDDRNDVMVLTKTESKDKAIADKFNMLLFNDQLDLIEKPVDLNGSYSLVYCQQLDNDDVVTVFAPKKGSADLTKYVYYRFDMSGNVKSKAEFTSPASALLISGAYAKDNDVYFFGTSKKSSDPFEKVFSEYASIYNPGYTNGGSNLVDAYWQKCLDQKMENFHLLKFSDQQLAFVSTTPIDGFKSKFKTAAGDKGASVYKGKRFYVENFYVTQDGDYLITGQLKSTVNFGTADREDAYEDILCFHLDKSGNLKAQYGVGKLNEDKKSEIFEMTQNFYPSPDGKSVYWEILEVKGTKGYEGFIDAYNGTPTFYPHFYPRVGKIDLGSASLSPFKVMGEGKYYLRKHMSRFYDKTEKSVTYFGHDEDDKKLWVGKMTMN